MKLPITHRPPIVRLPPKSNLELMLSRGAQAAVIVLGLLALLMAFSYGRFVMAPVAMAIVIGLMLGPLAQRIERTGIPPQLSALIVVLVFMVALTMLVVALAAPLSYWADRLPQIRESLQEQLSQLRQPLELMQGFRDELREVTGDEGFAVSVDQGSPLISIALMAPAVGAQIIIFLGSLYFFVATRNETRIAVLKLCITRRLRWRVAHIFRDVELLVSKYLLSITLINIGLAVAVTLALWAVGVPQPALWGALAGVLNFVIYIGPAIMAVILFAVGLATYDSFSGSIMPPLVYLAVNMIEAQFVTPMVIGRAMTLNPFLVFLALTFWIWIWGPVGGFVAIPALLIVFAIARNMIPGADLLSPPPPLARPQSVLEIR